MKTKSLLFAAAFVVCTFLGANAQTLLVQEDFSSQEWENEFLKQNPGPDEFGLPINPNAVKVEAYTTPPNTGGSGAYGPLNSTDLYFGKYKLGGYVEVLPTGVCSAGLTHANPTTGDAVAFRPNNGSGYFEFPTLTSAGTITIHVKNGNSTNNTNLGLEKYNSTDDTWERINLFLLRKRNDLKNEAGDALLDEALSFNVNSATPIKLRLNNIKYDDGLTTRFLNIYHIEVTEFSISAVLNPGANAFKQLGRKLIVEQPTKLSLYNMIGSLVFEQQVENHVQIPATIGNGIYIVRTDRGVQKILLK